MLDRDCVGPCVRCTVCSLDRVGVGPCRCWTVSVLDRVCVAPCVRWTVSGIYSIRRSGLSELVRACVGDIQMK